MPSQRLTALILSNILIPISIIIFATAFFPYKPFLPGLATFKPLRHVSSDFANPPPAQFNKLIFMVVDALRSDFVYSHTSGFAFTQSLVRSGDAIPFTAHATSPTITMPRVKAITTGSIPSFLDVILNFAESDTTSTLKGQDTWLAQIRAKRHDSGEQGKLIMYGDDTWLKLFPGMFSRSDGTTSFFVSDFTEVDNNVTRHVPNELLNKDWNAMIMHYLGLDHIGHKAGPLSPNMLPKQREMDGIVQQIYEAMQEEDHLQDALFVLAGDHGMNDGGNHGGSAPGETSPALVFMSPKLRVVSQGKRLHAPVTAKQDYDFYTKIEQSDIAPTIAGLLGLPISLNNLGVFARDFLTLWKRPTDQVQLVYRNAIQILDIVAATFPNEQFSGPADRTVCDFDQDGAQLACLWRFADTTVLEYARQLESADFTLSALYKFLFKAQSVMSSTASNYDVPRLILGSVLSTFAVICALVSVFGINITRPHFDTTGCYLALVIILYGIMMFASSYVEEEQHFWYWTTTGWLGLLYAIKAHELKHKAIRLTNAIAVPSVLAAHRIIQRWNQTGQKHAGASDIAKDYLLPHPVFFWILVLSTYLVVAGQLTGSFALGLDMGFETGAACAVFLVLPAILFKLAFTANDAPELLEWAGPRVLDALKAVSLVSTARLVFALIAVHAVYTVIRSRRQRIPRPTSSPPSSKGSRRVRFALPPESNINMPSPLVALLTLFLLTQSKTHNVPLFFLFNLQATILADHSLNLTPLQTTLTTFLMQHTAFFALGNSNAISSIDLSNGYNGISGYNAVAVGVLVFAGNWAGPIWWAANGLGLLVRRERQEQQERLSETQDRKVASKPDAETSNPSSRRKQPASWITAERSHLATQATSISPSTSPSSLQSSTSEKPRCRNSHLQRHTAILTLFTACSVLAVQIACTMLRTHLFIWTVFSPKYLFAMAWGLGFHLLVNIMGWAIGAWFC